MPTVKAGKCLQPSYTIAHNKFKVDQRCKCNINGDWRLRGLKYNLTTKIETFLKVEKYRKQLSSEISK